MKTHLKTHNHGHVQIQILGGGDDTLGNDITTHNTTEDVDQNAKHLRIGSDDLEGGLDRLGSGTTTDIQEIGRFTAIQLNDIHGGHGQTGAVHHAADSAIQGNVVQIVFGSLDFLGILLGPIAQRKSSF